MGNIKHSLINDSQDVGETYQITFQKILFRIAIP